MVVGKNLSIFLFLSLMFSLSLAGCQTTIQAKRFDTPENLDKTEKSPNRKIEIYLPLDDPPKDAVTIGHIAIGDTGFTTNCDQTTVLLQAKQQAKEMDGDAIHIYELKPPDFFSTCYRLNANVLSLIRPELTGTGFYIDKNGTMFTASHVIAGAKRIKIKCPGQTESEARVLKQSRNNDVAVITTGKPSKHYLTLGSNSDIKLGKDVFTIGYPVVGMLGKEPKYTEGNVSASSGLGDEQSLIQISVPVQPGNSGGPVITNDGIVVGIVVSTAAINTFFEVTNSLPQNINWATKIDYAKLLLDTPTPAKQNVSDVISHAISATCLVTTK